MFSLLGYKCNFQRRPWIIKGTHLFILNYLAFSVEFLQYLGLNLHPKQPLCSNIVPGGGFVHMIVAKAQKCLLGITKVQG